MGIFLNLGQYTVGKIRQPTTDGDPRKGIRGWDQDWANNL